MKFLKPFSQFINEGRYGGDEVERLDDQFGRQLDELGSFNNPVEEAISQFDNKVSELTQSRQYWYNREGRDIKEDHYAIDVKFHGYPDLEEFQEAVGPGMEVDGDDVENEWIRWLQMEIDDFESLFLDNYPNFAKVRWGGRSGGWMCPVPDNSPDDMVSELTDVIIDYLREFEDLDEDDIAQLQDYSEFSEEERNRLGDLGLTNSDLIERLSQERGDTIAQIERKIEELQSHEEGLNFIIRKHAEFRKTAKETFLNYARESQ